VSSDQTAACQLEVRGLSRHFGRLAAVNDVDLRVYPGELKAIIGPNGAGKTTLFNLISGLLRPSAGSVLFEGRLITGLPVHAIAARGIARSFQLTNLFPQLTVYENVRIAAQAHSGKAWNMLVSAEGLRDVQERCLVILDEVGLLDKRDLTADTLSHGDRRLLDLAMALVSDPKLLLLDEPTAGMSPAETMRMAELIPALGRGRTILLVEHDMDLVMSVATSIVVLTRGSKLAEGPPEEIQQDVRVQEAYLGGVV
jgi:branched-chain amino acid transport system ATP-binding protein